MKLLKLISTTLLTTILLIGCSGEAVVKETNVKDKQVVSEVELYKDDFELASPFEKKISDKTTVLIDPKIESAYLVLEMLYPETGYTQTYGANSMENQKLHFSKFRNHKVFDITLEMFGNGL